MKGAHMWLLKGRAARRLHRIAQPLKSQHILIPQKQHLTATAVSAFTPTVFHHPPIYLLLFSRARANTGVIDADG